MKIRIPFTTRPSFMFADPIFIGGNRTLLDNGLVVDDIVLADMQQWAVDAEHEDSYRRAVERGRRNED